MKRSQVQGCYSFKLGCRIESSKRHIHFRILDKRMSSLLPTILCISRSPGEITEKEKHGNAQTLGINTHLLERFVSCTIKGICLKINLVARFLEERSKAYNRDPIFFSDEIESVRLICTDLVEEIESELKHNNITYKDINADENKVFERASNNFLKHSLISQFEPIRKRMSTILMALSNKYK